MLYVSAPITNTVDSLETRRLFPPSACFHLKLGVQLKSTGGLGRINGKNTKKCSADLS